MTPVSPPITKSAMNPSAQSSGARITMRPPRSVASQQKTWMPLGIAIIMLAAVKNASPSCGRPTANMWCTHRLKPRKPVAMSASTMAG